MTWISYIFFEAQFAGCFHFVIRVEHASVSTVQTQDPDFQELCLALDPLLQAGS